MYINAIGKPAVFHPPTGGGTRSLEPPPAGGAGDGRYFWGVVGVDPGVTGGVAILPLWGDWSMAGRMATVDYGAKTRFGALDTRLIPTGAVAFVELVHSMPRQGVASAFSFGLSTGAALGALFERCHSVYAVTPQRWKGDLRLSADKAESTAMAVSYFPKHAAMLGLKVNNGVAEALLIAYWGRLLLEKLHG